MYVDESDLKDTKIIMLYFLLNPLSTYAGAYLHTYVCIKSIMSVVLFECATFPIKRLHSPFSISRLRPWWQARNLVVDRLSE